MRPKNGPGLPKWRVLKKLFEPGDRQVREWVGKVGLLSRIKSSPDMRNTLAHDRFDEAWYWSREDTGHPPPPAPVIRQKSRTGTEPRLADAAEITGAMEEVRELYDLSDRPKAAVRDRLKTGHVS